MKQKVILILIVLTITVFTQPSSVRLEYDFEANPFQAFQMATKTSTELFMFGMQEKTGSELVLNIHREAEPGRRAGTYKVKNIIESGKIEINGEESAYGGAGTSTEVLMDKTGKIIENLSSEGKEITELQVDFPDKKVKIGDVWGTTANFDISDVAEHQSDFDIAVTFVLKGFENFRGEPCAVIESRFDTTKVEDDYLKMEVKGNGKIYFAYESGKMMGNFTKLKIDVDILSDKNDAGRIKSVFALSVDMETRLTSM
ncbi:MAG: hypothetical protein ACQESP_06145 [Candidatus Muiribacteriota bacterium]